MSRQLRLYILYGSPLLMFFILLTVLHYAAGFGLLLSFCIAAIFALGEFFALRFVFSRLHPQD